MRRSPEGPGSGGAQHVLEVDVGADQEVAEQEHLPLLGLEQLPAVPVHRLGQRLAQQQLPLPRAQQLQDNPQVVTPGWRRHPGAANLTTEPEWPIPSIVKIQSFSKRS